MSLVATALLLLSAAWLLRLAAIYVTGPVPVGYHAQLLEALDAPHSDGLRTLMRAIYTVLAGALAASAVGIAVLALLAHGQGASLALFGVALVTGLSCGTATLVLHGMERRVGPRTPWRTVAGICGLAILGLVLSLV